LFFTINRHVPEKRGLPWLTVLIDHLRLGATEAGAF